jgi:hypothetical protein
MLRSNVFVFKNVRFAFFYIQILLARRLRLFGLQLSQILLSLLQSFFFFSFSFIQFRTFKVLFVNDRVRISERCFPRLDNLPLEMCRTLRVWNTMT